MWLRMLSTRCLSCRYWFRLPSLAKRMYIATSNESSMMWLVLGRALPTRSDSRPGYCANFWISSMIVCCICKLPGLFSQKRMMWLISPATFVVIGCW